MCGPVRAGEGGGGSPVADPIDGSGYVCADCGRGAREDSGNGAGGGDAGETGAGGYVMS